MQVFNIFSSCLLEIALIQGFHKRVVYHLLRVLSHSIRFQSLNYPTWADETCQYAYMLCKDCGLP